MPAFPGLAEVGQQLRAVRQRANRLVLLDVACGAASVVTLSAAAVVAAALYGSGPSFRLTLGIASGTAAGAIAAAAVIARRRWTSLVTAARMADRRGALADRLTTLAALPTDGGPSPLVPLLIAQTAQLYERWRPPAVIPRRLPRTAVAWVAALGVLAALLAWPRLPPGTWITRSRPPAPPSLPPRSASEVRPPERSSVVPGGNRDGGTDREIARANAPSSGGDRSDAGDQAPTDLPDGEDAAASPLASLPAQWQHAIRAAVRGESAGRSQPVASGVSRQPRTGPGAQASSADAESGAPSSEGKPGTAQDVAARAGKHAPTQLPGDGNTPPPGATGGDAGTRPARPGESAPSKDQPPGDPKQRGGAAPPAGGGTQAGNLLAQKPDRTGPGGTGSAPFKVTITSFLKALDEQPGAQRPAARSAGSRAPARPAPALSDTQLADDLLRKAEVPPEYEELVRRVYSTREEP